MLLALALRVALFLLARPWDDEVLRNTILVTDAGGYHTLALGILQSGSFATFGAFRTPVYLAFVSAVYSVVGIKPWDVLSLIPNLLLHDPAAFTFDSAPGVR